MLSIRPSWAWFAFTGASLAAVSAGALVARASGVASHVWTLNLAAWVGGALLAFVVARLRAPPHLWIILALVGLVATFAFPGLTGVHRWLELGPVRLNAALLLMPPAVAALAALGPGPIGQAFVFACLALFVVQPDASQAVALAGGAAAIFLQAPWSAARRTLMAIRPALFAVVAFLRFDPLQPVPAVEGILGLAARLSPLAAGAAALALACVTLAPRLFGPQAWPLVVWLALVATAAAWGAYPVPLVGMGVSPILGVWLAVGVLAAGTSRRD